MQLRLREVRTAKGISQATLARVIGKTHSVISKYERNLVPILAEDLYKIAKALQVTMDDLVVEEPTCCP